MVYKQKLEEQIAFAKNKMLEAELVGRPREVDTWNGYRQGLKYALAELDGYGYPKEPVLMGTEVASEQCQCDHTDLQPHGECICGVERNSVTGAAV